MFNFPGRLHTTACLVSLVFLTYPATAAPKPARPPAAQRTAAQGPQSTTLEKSVEQQRAEIKTYTLPPEKYKKAVEYSRARYGLYFINFVYGSLVLLLLLGWKAAPKFRDWAERASSRRLVQCAIFALVLLLTLSVLGLPTDIYGHWLAVKYEQSIQSWPSWAWDWTKSQLISVVVGSILVAILFGVIRRSPRRWWFYFWLASLPIIVFLVFISPVVIDPMFFKFEPLEKTQPALVAEIEKVLLRGGMQIPRARMFEMKASEKLKAVDAYVSGIGASQRVVVWDTTLAKMTTPQTLYVFGHEMGHYVLGHIPKTMAFSGCVLLLFLYLGFRGMQWALGKWGAGWAVRGVDDWASLPLLLLFFSVFSFLGSPVFSGFSRYQEHQADVYGLEVIHTIVPDSQQAAAQSFQILGEIDLDEPDPSPFIRFWLYSHPSIKERVEWAAGYDPWSKNQPRKFVQ